MPLKCVATGNCTNVCPIESIVSTDSTQLTFGVGRCRRGGGGDDDWTDCT